MDSEDYTGLIYLPSFLLHSKDSNLYLLWLISDDLHRYQYGKLNFVANPTCPERESKYIEIQSIEYITIHDGKYKSISYKVKFGRGYQLPRLIDVKTGQQ